MSLVECRYNRNHKMKKNKLEIHEQKCPDRLKCKIKYIQCPYDVTHKIKEEEYANHILECKSKPNITVEQQLDIARASALNDIATEKEQIKMAREKFYKGCVVEEEITGLGKSTKKKNKKKQNKLMTEKFSEVTKKEVSLIGAMVSKTGEMGDDGEQEVHHLDNFNADQYFDLDDKGETEDKIQNFESINDNNESKNKEKEKDNKKENEKKEEKENVDKKLKEEKNKYDLNKNENNIKKNKAFLRYDPNEEDREINQYSANILIPHEINKILGIE